MLVSGIAQSIENMALSRSAISGIKFERFILQQMVLLPGTNTK